MQRMGQVALQRNEPQGRLSLSRRACCGVISALLLRGRL